MNPVRLLTAFAGVVLSVLFYNRLSALREIRHSKERLSVALAAGRTGTFEWNAQTKISHWSPDMYSLYGVPDTGASRTYEDWLELVLPERRTEADAAFREALLTGEFRLDFPIRRPSDGEIRWMAAQARVEFDKERRPVRVVGVNADITDQKRVEEQLRDTERRLKLAIEIADIAPWQYELSQDRLTVTPEWKSKLKLDSIEDSPAAWLACIHPDDQDAVLTYFIECQKEPDSDHRIEFRLRTGDSEERWIACRAIAMKDDANRVVSLFGTHLDITDRKRNEKRIREEALHDPLTGLPNRALLTEYSNHLLSAARRGHGTCALLFVDLDRFKPINDTYGHDAGDAVLIEVARRLRTCTRQEDVVARLGGDEFAILLAHTHTGHNQENAIAQHLIDAVEKPIAFGREELHISPSIGMAYYPEQASDIESLLQKADTAMYQAKQTCVGGYRTFSEPAGP